jgi:hypothetical protein
VAGKNRQYVISNDANQSVARHFNSGAAKIAVTIGQNNVYPTHVLLYNFIIIELTHEIMVTEIKLPKF